MKSEVIEIIEELNPWLGNGEIIPTEMPIYIVTQETVVGIFSG